MPLTGEYAPSTSKWAREQAERFEATGGAEANTLRGVPIIVLTSVGAKSGKLRKTALMRVEHDGRYAVVASKGGAPEHPVWYYNLVEQPARRAAGRPGPAATTTRDWWRARSARSGGSGRSRRGRDYAGYQTRTDREIPVFVLEPRWTPVRSAAEGDRAGLLGRRLPAEPGDHVRRRLRGRGGRRGAPPSSRRRPRRPSSWPRRASC